MNIKLLKWNELTALSLSSDKSVALLTTGTVVEQDRLDFITALALTPTDITATVQTVGATSYTDLATDSFLLVDDDSAGAAVTITLPAVASVGSGHTVGIKKIGNTANVIIDGNASETIDGGLTATLTTQYESVTLVCDGTGWYIF
jgi:hypothetical protein